jgi:hypothetical protein
MGYETADFGDPEAWQLPEAERERDERGRYGQDEFGARQRRSGYGYGSPEFGGDYGYERPFGGYGHGRSQGDFRERQGQGGGSYEDERRYRSRAYEGGQGFGQGYGRGYGSEEREAFRRPMPGQGGRGFEQSPENFAGRGPKGYRRSDERVLEDVSQALEEDPRIDASEIEVVCHSGEIVLKGSVPDRRMKRLAEDCAENLPGVKDVRNELRVAGVQGAQDPGARGGRSSGGETEAE